MLYNVGCMLPAGYNVPATPQQETGSIHQTGGFTRESYIFQT